VRALNRHRARLAPAAVVGLALAACVEPGTPDYSSQVGLSLDAGPRPEALPGTEPFRPGMRRLAIGLFYEGSASSRLRLDAERSCLRQPHAEPLRCYFIFTAPGTGQLEYEQDTVADRVEGTLADRFTLTGAPFWGGGVVWDEPTDLSAWGTLAVALKSSDPSFAEVRIEMQSGTAAVSAFGVDATDYGFVNDGEWHVLRIPLAHFAGLDRLRIRAPFILSGTGNKAGDELLVDEVYLTQE